MHDVLLASNNAHKRLEMDGILSLAGASVRVVQTAELGFTWDSSEDGETFAANARQKADALYFLIRGELRPGVTCTVSAETARSRTREFFGGVMPPVIADDSGICVDALHGAPGVFSARFGDDREGRRLTDTERYEFLLESLAGAEERACHYVCHAVLVRGPHDTIAVEAPWHGHVLTSPVHGETGFGYDPVVSVTGNTSVSVATMTQNQKDLVSHRAQALRALAYAAAWL